MKNFELNFKTLAMAAASAAVVACSDYSPEEYEGNLTQEEYKTIVEYTKNFEDRYGKIDPDQDWGFEALAVKDETRSTRAWIFANSNIGNGNSGWVNVIKGNGGVVYGYENYKIYYNDGTSSEIVVPGFPSKTDGLYYVGSANTACASPYTQEQINAGAVKEGSGNIVGDVTNDEIVFVSRWFREHQNPESMSASELLANADSKVTLIKAEYAGCQDLKLNTFFVQHISGDEDRSDVNGSWKSNSPGYGMDQLMAKSNVTDSWGASDGTHINNFNSGSSVNKIDQNNPNSYDNVYNSRGIQLYVGNENETVYDFCYHNSQDDKYYNRYAIMHLVFKIGELTYDGYYLGFDYEKHSNGEWSADGYYNNWIVKISDALPKETSDPEPEPDNTTARVFCEDLGNTYDFDFNDLVFDIYYTRASEGNYTAHISVQAVGGTLPIYIGTDPNYELHKMMGYTDMKPINVGAADGHDGVGAYEFTISGCATTNPDYITICVQRNDNSATPTILPKTSSTKSLAPQKICIKNGTGVKWTKESQQIEWGYTDFAKWVEGNGDFGKDKKGFWEGEIKSDYLYR